MCVSSLYEKYARFCFAWQGKVVLRKLCAIKKVHDKLCNAPFLCLYIRQFLSVVGFSGIFKALRPFHIEFVAFLAG